MTPPSALVYTESQQTQAVFPGGVKEFRHVRVFLSYCSADTEITEKVCGILEANGIECWIAPRDVKPGSVYAEQIVDAIEGAAAVVVLCLSQANGSAHVRTEVERAFSMEKAIFPVRIEDVEIGKALGYFLSTSQWLDAWKPPLEEKIGQLAASLREMVRSGESEEHAMKPVTRLLPPKRGDLSVGRDGELNRLKDAVQRTIHESGRMVMLVGEPGIGKTRASEELSLWATGKGVEV